MKLFRFGAPESERPGVETADGRRVDVSSLVADYDPFFFAEGGVERLKKAALSELPEIPEDARFGPPIVTPGKILCVGLNYRDHALETGAALPQEPVLFMKAVSALAGPFDDLALPRNSEKTDWEVELAFVIGRTARYVAEREAQDYIAGYTVMNDYSEREWQKERGGQWVKGKSADGFAPLGPYLVTPDEISDPSDLRLWLKVNGELRQNGSTSDLIFSIPFLISYISSFMSLQPGDVISTGTPAGVGAGMSPPTFLKPGDLVELGIEGIGSSSQRICPPRF